MDPDLVLSYIKSLTVLIPLTIGLVRFSVIDKAYQPFIFYLAASFLAETVNFILIYTYRTSNAISSNIFVLAEWLLIIWQFYRWGYFKTHIRSMFLLIIVLVTVWIIENLIAGKLYSFSPYYRVLYSFAIVLMSISIINYTIIHHFENIFRNARFLICLCFIILFVYKMVYEWAYQVSTIRRYISFSEQIINYFGYVNAGINIIFAIAVLFIPTRNKYGIK